MENPSYEMSGGLDDGKGLSNGNGSHMHGNSLDHSSDMTKHNLNDHYQVHVMDAKPAQNGVSYKNDKNSRLERVLSVAEEVEQRREAERNRAPLRYCRWIVNRPKTWLCKSIEC